VNVSRDDVESYTNKKLNLKVRQIYVEEQSKIRNNFMIDSYNILKSLKKRFDFLLCHFLELDNEDQELITKNDINQYLNGEVGRLLSKTLNKK
jgi:hypothetical protein